MKDSKSVKQMLTKINRSKLRNNTQRVLLALLQNENEWVSRVSLRIPSATSRIRDLRMEEFGGFQVDCATPKELNKKVRSRSTRQPTFYRVNPRSVTTNRLAKIFEGVIA